jgi:hypothetical protein
MPKKKIKEPENYKINQLDKKLIGIKIVSVFHYVIAGFLAIMGLFTMLSANSVMETILNTYPELAQYGSGTFIPAIVVIGLCLIGIGIFNFFIGRDLWRLKPWARIAAITLSLINIVIGIYSLIFVISALQVIRLVAYIPITIYLLFYKQVKHAFNNNKKYY